MSAGDLAYVDTSAYLKLLREESESEALRVTLADWPRLVSSEILAVELHRAAYRAEVSETDCEILLSAVDLIPLTDEIRSRAKRIGSPLLRTLDAIHIATAESLGETVGALFVYDQKFIEEALLLELPAVSPAPGDLPG